LEDRLGAVGAVLGGSVGRGGCGLLDDVGLVLATIRDRVWTRWSYWCQEVWYVVRRRRWLGCAVLTHGGTPVDPGVVRPHQVIRLGGITEGRESRGLGARLPHGFYHPIAPFVEVVDLGPAHGCDQVRGTGLVVELQPAWRWPVNTFGLARVFWIENVVEGHE
jgi:hypothetical protein